MAWVETQSLSFTARHESTDARAAEIMLGRLEAFRTHLSQRFPRSPGELAVVVHPRAVQLALAEPWVPLMRALTAPASRRYLAGWFSRDRLHVLSPRALEARASSVEGSLEALRLAPLHEYAHVVLGLNHPALPPPFNLGTVRGYLRQAWLCEGAATHLSGQSHRLGAAVARRLREGSRPTFPPAVADAFLLGGTLFDLLAEEGRGAAALELARGSYSGGAESLERAFGRPARAVEADWRDYVASFAGG